MPATSHLTALAAKEPGPETSLMTKLLAAGGAGLATGNPAAVVGGIGAAVDQSMSYACHPEPNLRVSVQGKRKRKGRSDSRRRLHLACLIHRDGYGLVASVA